MPKPVIHNLGPNSNETSPHEMVILDTETRTHAAADDEVHALRCWSAQLRRRHGRNPSRPRRVAAGGDKPQQIAAWIDSLVKTSPTVWVYAHNLSFDLAVTRLPVHLAALGWAVTSHNLASDAPWAMMRQGNRTLRLADSHSVLPVGVAQLGELAGTPKLPLPTDEDPIEVWQERCESDVQITADALEQLMDWWDQGGLGHWSVTGPRTGWNAMRHRCVKRPGMAPIVHRGASGSSFVQHGDGHVVIDPDPAARKFERDTLYQGRREAWRVGVQAVGDYGEMDMRAAHLTVARELRLPCRRGVAFDSLDVDSPYLMGANVAAIARVVVDTALPRYPLRVRGGIVHPVGRFETVLAGPELADARERGELVSVGAGYFYRLSYHMQPWADWLTGVLQEDGQDVPPAAMVAAKGWSRSVPGTWAARTSRVVLEGTSPVDGWSATHGIYAGTGESCSIVHLNGRMQISLRDQEGDDSFPAVLSFIQSYVRVALNRAVDAVEPWRLVACSTDSVLVDMTGGAEQLGTGLPVARFNEGAKVRAARLAGALTKLGEPFEFRVKGTAALVEVLSPQHVRLDGDRRYSGVPKGAVEVEHNVFRFHTWPKLGRQMEIGERRGFVRQLRPVDLRGVTVARYVAGCGCTAAPRADMGRDGVTVLLPPAGWGCYRHEQPWEDRQWPGLPGVLG